MSDASVPALPSRVSPKLLIAIYGIVPLLMLVVLADFLTGGLLRLMLPKRPEVWSFWIYVFGLPHIFASFFLLADREYLQYFGGKLWKMALFLLALPIFVYWQFGSEMMVVIFTAMIVYHTIAQQFGIALILAKQRPTWVHQANTIIGSALGVVLYLNIYATGSLGFKLRPHISTMEAVSWIMLAVVFGITLFQIRMTKERYGRVYMWLNLMLLTFMVSMFNYGFSLLMIIAGRVVHEFTAWLIYAAHDKNRSVAGDHNLVYRYFAWSRISPYWMGIVLAFLFGMAFTYLSGEFQGVFATLVISMSLYHYWVECVIWKGNSPPKRHIVFA